VALTLKLLYLWGAPIAWTLDGEDERALARMLVELETVKRTGARSVPFSLPSGMARLSEAGRGTASGSSLRSSPSTRRGLLFGPRSKTPPRDLTRSPSRRRPHIAGWARGKAPVTRIKRLSVALGCGLWRT
jgi:hypothetical protein